MKTITDMQKEIKVMSATLDELARDLSEYNKTENKKEEVDFKNIKSIGKRNPVKNHALENLENGIKKKYITMLMTVAYMIKEKNENAWLLIQGISTGIGLDEELIDLNVDAANLTYEQIDEFTLSIAEDNLTNAFMLDAMLIYLADGKGNEKMIEFMSALFELLKCDRIECECICELAVSIVEQNFEKYRGSKAIIENRVNLLCVAYPYVAKYINKVAKEIIYKDELVTFIGTKINQIIKMGNINGEPLLWRVIEKVEGKSLLLCEDSICNMVTAIKWSESPIRKYLNDEFYKKSFTQEEKSAIITNSLNDYIFLLSKEEVERNLKTDSERELKNGDWWWLSSYCSNDLVWGVSSSGSFDDYLDYHDEYAVRPAFWINL